MPENQTTDPDFDDKEHAEGDRQTVNEALADAADAMDGANSREQPQGISNRPAAEEARAQAKLPPRGEAKE
jgi:hypothetical protein